MSQHRANRMIIAKNASREPGGAIGLAAEIAAILGGSTTIVLWMSLQVHPLLEISARAIIQTLPAAI